MSFVSIRRKSCKYLKDDKKEEMQWEYMEK